MGKQLELFTTEAQEKRILDDLKRGRTITPLGALHDYGCFRLGARIWDLKKKGHQIRTDMIEQGGKRYAGYSLVTNFKT